MSRKFAVKAVPSSWLEGNGHRLDCGPYLSGAIEAREMLKRHKTQPLRAVTAGHQGGIFNGPRFARTYVDDPAYGVPFLGSTDILDADLTHLPLLSKGQVAGDPALLVEEGWSLITCSGTIGRMAYARADMAGMAGSQHFMRVAPNRDVISPGYLYAYLSSRFGVPLIVSGTYGAIIQHIEPAHIADLPVPRLDPAVETAAHDGTELAAANRVRASELIAEAIAVAEQCLGLPHLSRTVKDSELSVSVESSSRLLKRMDSFYYAATNAAARAAFDEAAAQHGSRAITDVADVWIPGIFKRQYVDDPTFGVPYFTGSDLYQLAPSTDSHLQLAVAEAYRLIVRSGMIVIQDSGQVSGLIGTPTIVSRHLDGAACTNNMVRIHCPSANDAGYLFALLSTGQGIRLLKREATGSSIPHLEEGRIKSLMIPWPSQPIRESIGQRIVEAMELRDDAISADFEARAIVEAAIEGSA